MPSVTLTVRLPVDEWQRLADVTQTSGVTVNAAIRQAVAVWCLTAEGRRQQADGRRQVSVSHTSGAPITPNFDFLK